MSRWNRIQSFALPLPLEALVKEKENTNRPVAARSAGTVGKWGITSFTSIRGPTYAFAASFSPKHHQVSPNASISPHSNDGAVIPSTSADLPKPRKFFKSRNVAPEIPPTQQQLQQQQQPQQQHQTVAQQSSPPKIRMKINKKLLKTDESKSPKKDKVVVEKKPVKLKKKSKTKEDTTPKIKIKPIEKPTRVLSRTRKPVNYLEDRSRSPSPYVPPKEGNETESVHELSENVTPEIVDDDGTPTITEEPTETILVPEPEIIPVADAEPPAPPPPEVLVEEPPVPQPEVKVDEIPSPIVTKKRAAANKSKNKSQQQKQQAPEEPLPKIAKKTLGKSANKESLKLPKKKSPKLSNKESSKLLSKESPKSLNKESPKLVIVTPKAPQHDHPPIVLRISKGTSRLISTDSEEVVTSPPYLSPKLTAGSGALASTAELLAVLSDESPSSLSQILPTSQLTPTTTTTTKEVTLPKEQQSSLPPPSDTITQSNVQVQHHKPAGIKIKIKTNLAKAFITSDPAEKPPQLSPPPPPPLLPPKLPSPVPKSIASQKSTNSNSSTAAAKQRPTRRSTRQNQQITECKAAAAALTTMKTNSPQPGSEHYDLYRTLTASPSDKDFDSQSSILGSGVSSNFVAEIPEDSQVIHSRGSSDVTSDQDTSQNSSLVAPPSEIDLRLAAMMDGDEPMPSIDLPPTTSGLSTAVVPEKIPSPVIIRQRSPSPVDEPVVPPPPPPVVEGRVTRNKNGLTQKKSETTTAARPLVTRSYGRKRKQAVETSPIVEPTTESVNATNQTPTIIDNTLLKTSTTKPLTNEINLILPPLADKDDMKLLSTATDDIDGNDAVNDTPATPKYKYNKRTRRSQQQQQIATNNEQTEKNNHKTNDTNTQSTLTTSENVKNMTSGSKNENNNTDDCAEGEEGGGEDKPSVKLVISKKKGSIFKSRAIDSEAGGANKQQPKRHVYKHKWDDDNMVKDKQTIPQNDDDKNAGNKSSYYTDFDDDAETSSKTGLTRVTRQPSAAKAYTEYDEEDDDDDDDEDDGDGATITSVRCKTKAKKFYTVVRNVKKAHQIQEIGEFQEMDDDIEYILDALQPHNKMSTRCLSAIQLASKCMAPAFRMHVRAHGTVTKFFKALSDAAKDQSLGLCTATVMFVLNQDNLNMDLDRNSLELMLNLLESDVSHKHALDNCGLTREQLQRNRQKVKELCSDIKAQGKAAHLNVDNITSGTLAMETLLSLTSKRAGEWFKEELRKLGGLEHIINTVCECCRQISDYVVEWTDVLLEKLRKIERCLRVLENVSNDNEENQSYILAYRNEHAIDTLIKFYKLCDSEITLYPTTDSTPKENPGVVLREALVPTIKVLINLTHPFNRNAHGSQILGGRPIIFDTSLHLLLQASNYVPERCIFDLSLLVLLLLINLTTYTIPNRTIIMKASAPSDFGNQFDKVSAVKALIEYFYKCEELARLAEKKTDDILDNPNKSDGKQSQEEVDETVTKLLQKAGHHMEHSMLASYVSLLIGHLIMDNDLHEMQIRKFLRKGCFDEMVQILEKYYNFMNLTTSSSSSMTEHIKQTNMIIKYLKNSDSHSKSSNSSSSM